MATTVGSTRVQDNELKNPAEDSLPEQLARTQRDLQDVIGALSLLGVKRCSRCEQFFNSADPGALFGNGVLVCYGCLPEWWQSYPSHLNVDDREKLETRLSSWLKKHHGAQVIKEDVAKSDQLDPSQFEITVHCGECGGSGKLLEGERCRFCNGCGTVRLVAAR